MYHCMMAVPQEAKGFPLLSFPNVCVCEPKPGSVFCREHHDLLSRHRVPVQKDEFLRYIGCKGTNSSENIVLYDTCLSKMSVMHADQIHLLDSFIAFIPMGRALIRILKIGVKTLPSRKSWSFTIHFYWHLSKSWSQIQKVGVSETSEWGKTFCIYDCYSLQILYTMRTIKCITVNKPRG